MVVSHACLCACTAYSACWPPQEDAVLLEGHAKFGNKWTEIAKIIGGRTDNAVKNRFQAIHKRKAYADKDKSPEAAAKPPKKKVRTLAAEPLKPCLKIEIPVDADDDEDHNGDREGYQVKFGPNSVTFSEPEMGVVQDVVNVLGPILRTTSYQALSTRGAPSTSTRGVDAKLQTPSFDPKLLKGLSKEVINLLHVFGGAPGLTSNATTPGGATSAHDGGPLMSTMSVDPATTTSNIIKNAAAASAAAATATGFGVGSLAESLSGTVSPHMMPSTARIMQKLYAIRTGLTPKDVAEAGKHRSLNFKNYLARNGDNVDGVKQQLVLAEPSMTETFDVAQLLSSPTDELGRRRSPRIATPQSKVSANPASHAAGASEIIHPVSTKLTMSPGLSVEFLMPMPSGLRQQDFEFFLSVLPEVPPEGVYGGHLADEADFNVQK